MGEPFGNYTILEKLGSGGMAAVHIAESTTLRKRVALKRLHAHVAENRELVRSFIHEARLARYLNHMHIARTFDFGKVGDTYFMAMELVPGPNLTQLTKQVKATVGTIPLAVILHIIAQILDALDYAHNLTDEHGEPLDIIHRDISPPNIIVSNTGTVKLIDFGLAKAARSSIQTQVGTIKGKFSYIAPEYLNGHLDNRVDIWAVGVIAWELLTMRRLFDSPTDIDVLDLVRNHVIVPPSRYNREVTGELDAIVLTALERDPRRRWQSAAAMRVALRNCVRELGIEITDRRVLQWVEWAFSQDPDRAETSGMNELMDLLDTGEAEPSVETSAPTTPGVRAPSGVRTPSGIKRPKLPTPVVGAQMVKRRRGRRLVWLLLVALLGGGAYAAYYYDLIHRLQ
ncbi:MAG: serine/threonine protein kinase [Deltaproteobacteria bacterium]|nr:serine/threonine protein kinase [Deltaproteobacteria bacterium]